MNDKRNEIAQVIKSQVAAVNFEQTMRQHNLASIFFSVESYGHGGGDRSINARSLNGGLVHYWGANTPEWLTALTASPEADELLEQIALWAESFGEFWDSEEGGEAQLTLSLDENGGVASTLELSYREEEEHNGHFESETEVLLSNESNFSSWQQVFAYFRKAKRKNPDCNLSFTLRFWGGGDSGSIEDIEAGCDILDKLIALPDGTSETVRSLLESFAYRFIDASGVDWYNNEGGGGSMELKLEELPVPKAIFDLSVNYYEMVLKPHMEIKL